MNYYNEIKNKLINNEVYKQVKDYSKERYKVITYFEIGRLLSIAENKYGSNIIEEYSNRLVTEVNKLYNKRTLFRMRQFYNVFKSEKVSTLSTQLSWSHYTELLPIKDKEKLLYYLTISINQNINVRDLRAKIKSKEYERLSEDTKLKLSKNSKLEVQDLVKNPIVINNPTSKEIITEKALKLLILEDLDEFLLELGEGFTYIANEYKIKIGNTYNYIDLLLFNYKYNCFVVVELKITELKKEHIGQIQVYMNYVDKNLKSIYQDKTIGLIICKKDNKFIIEYSSDTRIFSSSYILR